MHLMVRTRLQCSFGLSKSTNPNITAAGILPSLRIAQKRLLIWQRTSTYSANKSKSKTTASIPDEEDSESEDAELDTQAIDSIKIQTFTSMWTEEEARLNKVNEAFRNSEAGKRRASVNTAGKFTTPTSEQHLRSHQRRQESFRARAPRATTRMKTQTTKSHSVLKSTRSKTAFRLKLTTNNLRSPMPSMKISSLLNRQRLEPLNQRSPRRLSAEHQRNSQASSLQRRAGQRSPRPRSI
jgi:hypothetical protein